MFKELILELNEAGLENYVYYSFHVIGLVTAFLNALNDAKHLNINISKAALSVSIIYPIIYGLRYVMKYAENLFFPCTGDNIIRSFVFIPLVVLFIAKILNIDNTKLNQIIAPIPCVGQGISKLGCIFTSCCYGYKSTFGIYNYWCDYICIPVQFYESLSALLIALYLEVRYRKNKWESDPKALPIMFILFGLSRFFLEFLRDNKKYMFNISELAMHSMLMAIVGTIWLITIRIKEEKSILTD